MNGSMMHYGSRLPISRSWRWMHYWSRLTICGSRRWMHYRNYRGMMHCMSYGSMATKKTSMGCMHCRGMVNWVGYCRGMVNWVGNCGGMVNCMGYCRGMVHSMGYWGWVGF